MWLLFMLVVWVILVIFSFCMWCSVKYLVLCGLSWFSVLCNWWECLCWIVFCLVLLKVVGVVVC